MGKVVLPTHMVYAPTPPCPTHSQKWLTPSLALGWHALRASRRDLTEKIPLSEKFVGRLPHRLTWVWRKRGIASLESACGITSYVDRGKCV